MEITGLSMAARAEVVNDPVEGEKALRPRINDAPSKRRTLIAAPAVARSMCGCGSGACGPQCNDQL